MHDTHQAIQEWCCRGCDGAFLGSPPWHRLCIGCLASLKAQGLVPDPTWPEDEILPVCQDCGTRLIPVIPIGPKETGDDD